MARLPKLRDRCAAASIGRCHEAPLFDCTIGYNARVSLCTGTVTAWHAACCEFFGGQRDANETVSPVSLGGWAILHACVESRYWPDRTISVDVSRRQLVSGIIVEQVDAALTTSGLPPSKLELVLADVTPSSLERPLLQTIWSLRDRGVGLMLGDAGYDGNGMSILRRVPATAIALPARAVAAASRFADEAAFLRVLVTAARTLDLTIVANGVDTAEQRAVARALGCMEAEGTLFAALRPQAGGPAGEENATCSGDSTPSELQHEYYAATH